MSMTRFLSMIFIMSHVIYQTEGIILRKKDFGEADIMLTIFTEKFGKINAVAQGARHLKSKLRYNLGTFSRSRLGLVASKSALGGWRIVDAEEIDSHKKILLKPENLAVLSRIAGIADRMVQGEDKNIFLWNKIKEIFDILSGKKLDKKELQNLEVKFLFDILKNLGYIDIQGYKTNKEAISAINKAIRESML